MSNSRGALLTPGTLTADERVYQELRTEIISGRLSPGTRLVHRKLAQRMGTSPVPIVNALRRLEGEGLLVSTPGLGTQVRTWPPDEIEEIYLLRGAHEGVACRLFTQRATRGDFALLERYHQEFDTAAEAGLVSECEDADERLHLHIARAARSAELRRLVEGSGYLFLTIRNLMLPSDLRAMLPAGPVGVHEPLVRALKSRSPLRAERAGREHVVGGSLPEQVQIRLLEARGRPSRE
jgi:DNA-binding GntR family transcriptional regulator